MKKLSILAVLALAGCASPDVIRPYIDGPVYYKQPTCNTINKFPEEITRWNYEIGMYEVYKTYEPSEKVICNYDPHVNPQTLNDLYK